MTPLCCFIATATKQMSTLQAMSVCARDRRRGKVASR